MPEEPGRGANYWAPRQPSGRALPLRLGSDGSVAYLFNRIGVLTYPSGSDEDVLMEVALEAGRQMDRN